MRVRKGEEKRDATLVVEATEEEWVMLREILGSAVTFLVMDAAYRKKGQEFLGIFNTNGASAAVSSISREMQPTTGRTGGWVPS